LVRRGYIVAIQDCRGRFNSDGVFDPYRQEHLDGFDTIEWIEAQAWCDGNIGMIGGSYVGQTQWFAASHAPKALKAIVPTASPPGHPFLNEPFYGGVMIMAAAEWMFAMGRRCERLSGMQGLYTQEPGYYETLPLTRLAEAAGVDCPWWNEWMLHPTYDSYWRSQGYEDYWSHMKVPALNVTGWWDMNFLGGPRNFAGMRDQAATEEAREGQRLVIGPWAHWPNQARSLSGLDFGPDSLADLDTYTLLFFDYWLRGFKNNGLDRSPRVHIFVIGANEWWEADSWPLPGTHSTQFFLHSGGCANTHRGDGNLSRLPPKNEPSDQFVSDPLDVVRILWNLHEGPVDDRALSARPDVLCYTSDFLDVDLDVVGPVAAVLYASSSAKDCDWHLRLVDVYPDGTARFLCHGALRARFRSGYDCAIFLEPGKIERFEIDMTATGVRFLKGHRIRLEISSTWFSRFERNPQTDAENWMTDERPSVVAQQKIYHEIHRASYVSLPLVTHSTSTRPIVDNN
jgi:putative CocE/NonD family hydrolase